MEGFILNKRGLIITIDGPAGAGKSTIAKKLACQLNYKYINTGDIYRYLTYRAIVLGLDIEDDKTMDNLSFKLSCEMTQKSIRGEKWSQLVYSKKNILDLIHSPEIDKKVSIVAQHKSVRKNLVRLQRDLGREGAVVMEGRDIGSCILPEADIKLFFTANNYTRTMRRLKELKEKGFQVDFQEVERDIIKRDNYDSQRKIAPLKQTEDSIIIDTSNQTVNGILKKVLNIVQSYLRRRKNENSQS